MTSPDLRDTPIQAATMPRRRGWSRRVARLIWIAVTLCIAALGIWLIAETLSISF